MVGGAAFYMIGWLLSMAGVIALVDWIMTSSYHPIAWINTAAWLLAGIFAVIISSLAMVVVIMVMRRIGLRASRLDAQKMMVIASVLYLIVILLQMKAATTAQITYPSVAMQVWGTYLLVMEFGLPFSIAWLWIAQRSRLDRPRRKA